MMRWDAISLMNQLGNQKTPFLFIIDYLANAPLVIPLSEVDPNVVKFKVNHLSNSSNRLPLLDNKQVKLIKHPISFEAYSKKFDMVFKHLQKGNSYLTNLTCITPIETDKSLSQIYDFSHAPYKLWYNNQFVVFSPETFVKIEHNKIYSFPMKGTINASVPNAKEVLLADYKESAEHATITDLIRNDLGMVSNNIRVEKYRFISTIKTNQGELHQVSSKISGELDSDWQSRIGSMLFTLLPAGSICGAPKPMTLEIIQQAEQYNRGYYTGIFGIFDGENLDSGVMIRFIEQTPQGKVFKSGGGITVYSNAITEYNELIDKVYLPF